MDLTFFDIQYYNWVKAAFVASLRAIFGSEYVPPQYRFVDDEEETKILIYTAFPYRTFKAPCIVVDVKSGSADVSFTGPQEQVGKVDLKEFRIVLTKGEGNTDPIVVNGYSIPYSAIESVTITGYNNYQIIEGPNGETLVRWDDPVPYQGTPLEVFISLKKASKYLYFTGILRLSIEITIYASTVTDVEKLTDIITVLLRFFLRSKLAELKIVYTNIDISGIDSVEWNGELLYRTRITVGNCHTEYELVFPESLLGYLEKINLQQTIVGILNETELTVKVFSKEE